MKTLMRITMLASGLGLLNAATTTAYGAVADELAFQNAGAPMVQITKNCPQLRYLGREAVFEIVVTNSGGGAAQNVVVTDRITGNIQFISADNDGKRQGNDIVWRLGTLPAGESRTLTARFRCTTIGTIRNAASVTYCAEAMDECELEVKGIPAILIECVDDPDPIELNGELTYTITVTNQGTAIGTNIAITCTLPPEEEYVSSTGPTSATADGKTITFAPLATLAPKAKATYTVRVKGVGTGDVRFKVEMKSDQMTSHVMETESTRIYN
ncbi:MAG: DUF11 domain-containing protein [Planctomycetota bacterium]|nr:MAG: DUF11 domain-containing protein [Planctomycetota bacterium]